MCGIVGKVSVDRVDADSVRAMLSGLAHRGPDGDGLVVLDEGRVALGHARLAIIDLSDTGRQPMADEERATWITFNGEIYNYKALRRELETRGHRFRSSSDTEVILRGYREWGSDVVTRLGGIFAFALWDAADRALLLARDHLGVKPLYYAPAGRGLAFASEPKALPDRAAPSREAISDFLTYGYVPGARTGYVGVHKLLPGHVVTWRDGTLGTPRRYWTLPDDTSRAPEGALADRLRGALERSVTAQVTADVPVGVVVSGGLDSAAIAALMVRTGAAHEAFTIGFPRVDERPYARLLCDRLGLRLVEHELRDDAIGELLPAFVETYDEPYADTSGLPTLFLFSCVAAARRKVVLSGDGGDELFAGYLRYQKLIEDAGYSQRPWPWRALGATNVRHGASLLARYRTGRASAWELYFSRVRKIGYAEQRALLTEAWRPGEPEELETLRTTCWRDDLPALRAAQLFDLQTYLPDDILMKVDRASMAHGVEARVPLLDPSLVALAFTAPSRLQLRDGITKRLFKRAVAPLVPKELLVNRKKGFGLPIQQILGPVLAEWARRGRASSWLVRDGVVEPRALTDLPWNGDQRWLLFCLELWWRRWVRQDSHAVSSLAHDLGRAALMHAGASTCA